MTSEIQKGTPVVQPEKKPDAVERAAGGIFAKIQKKTGLDDKKIDEFQKKWLAIPENRTKYKDISTLPDVMGEELFAMFNDIIDFTQKQEGGKSHIFSVMKAEAAEIRKDPKKFAKQVFEQGKTVFGKGVALAKGFIAKMQKAPAGAPSTVEKGVGQSYGASNLSEKSVRKTPVKKSKAA